MAGDWIKIETNLAEKPEVLTLARRFMMNRWEVAGRLFRLWSWFDAHSTDGHAPGVTSVTLDEVIGWDGMSAGLEDVGWLEQTPTGVYIPRFDRHNGNPAKSRAQATRRKQVSRSDRDTRHAPTVTKSGLEKRREESESAPHSLGAESAPASPRIPEDDGPSVPMGTQSRLEELEKRIRSLRGGWKIPLAHHEKRLLFENMATLAALEAEDWQTLRDYLHTRLEKGAPGWQPTSRAKFIETVADVWNYAHGWKQKQRKSAPKAPAQTPPPESSPEDEEALQKFLADQKAKREKQRRSNAGT